MRPRRTALIALALVALASPAHAEDPVQKGGCGWDMVLETPLRFGGDTSGTYRGVVRVAVAFVSTTEVPVTADVTCTVLVNGAPASVFGPVHVVGAGAAAGPMSFTLGSTADVVSGWCTTVQLTGRPPRTDCWDVDYIQLPHAVLVPLRDAAEQPTCSALGGDVYAAGEWLVDCPPDGDPR